MLNKSLVLISALLLGLLVSLPASAASPVGTWSVSGKGVFKAKVQGKTKKLSTMIHDKFTFYKNGKFSMIDMNGTWKLKSNRYVIYISTEQIEEMVENFLLNAGYDAEVDLTSLSFGGTATNKNISGTFVLKANLYVSGAGSGTFSMWWAYSGKKAPSSASDAGASSDSQSLMHAVREVFPQVISGADLPFAASPVESAEALDAQ